ncbi:histidine kinase dimerization/phospho-acceptor domain-containing protein [Methylobacterium sp. 77]|uniref:histidine kinase dimerization/phospho-acceptor domain-containing protein n=1 Tax=Methylobacterium sp. 77 TaxID=1101192 RepID=UPI0018CADAB7|nr:histidine kinase dimerization/phospho-acceptor domain-containing protein [Methylobacterium sp. 77]
MSAADATWLVLDGTGERILLASAAAERLQRAIATDDSGRIAEVIRLAEQIRPRGLSLDKPTLVKLRFESRRLGPATTCLVLRTKDGSGRNLLILAPLDRVPGLRALAPKAVAEPDMPQTEATAPIETPLLENLPSPTGRVVWKSDADDRLTDISGAAAASIRPALIGKTWAALSQTRALLDAEGLLLALAQRRTFRAISVTLRTDGAPGALDLDISGTPIQRPGADFSGFNGFALVRLSLAPPAQEPETQQEREAPEDSASNSPTNPPQVERERDAHGIAEADAGKAPDSSRAPASEASEFPRTEATPEAVFLPVAENWNEFVTPHADAAPSKDNVPAREPIVAASEKPLDENGFATESSPVLSQDVAPSQDGGWTAFQDPHLSSHEHAAFREIARALGARFAGDAETDEPSAAVKSGDERVASGSVTPFPTMMARSAEPASDDPTMAVAATLERLPDGVMVYRGSSVLFANRRLLTMAGFAELADLAASGGIGRLFGGLVPHERTVSGAPAILTTAAGSRLSVDMQASELDWGGTPAQLLLIRDAAASEPARERVALQIADAFAGARAADAQAVLDSLDDAIITLDRNARIIGLNRSAATTFGLDPREIVGAGILSLFAPESAVDVLASIHGVAGPDRDVGAHTTPDVIGCTAAGMLPMVIRVAPLAGRDDGRMAMTVRDVRVARSVAAEASSARRAAEYASARKSDFLARISHEIRTPMNGILGFADMMLAEPFGPIGNERYRDYLGDIHASGKHVLSLVNDLLDLAKIEAGRLDLTFAEVPLNDVVTHCVAMLQPQALRDRIVVRTSFSNDLPILVADERSVRQAALNIIANAIAFTEAGGQVIVSTTLADRGEIALRVRDTGIGMTPDEVETALEPFRQIAVSGPAKGRPDGRSAGTGLGLPLTKALVEANHGRFRIESRKDEGTLVEMLFPPQAVTKTA